MMSNALETALKLAAGEPAHRPEFFQLLLAADIWLPAESSAERFDADTPVDLQHWEKDNGMSVIPFFTSQQAMMQVIEKQQAWLKMPARVLFEMTLGETLFLNPKSDVGKEFSPAEITHLLRGEGSVLTEQKVLDGGVSLLLSAIKQPPTQMINSLSQLFSKYKVVRRAFVAHIREAEDRPVNLLIGIEADGDITPIIQAAGSVAIDVLLEEMSVDICQVTTGEPGVSHFFTAHITPFYERRWGSFLRDVKPEQRII